MLHKASKIRVNVNIKQFSCLHSCDQIVRLAEAFVGQSAKQFVFGM